MDSKRWWASKIVWVNLVALVATVAPLVGLDMGLDAEKQASIVAGVMAVVNIVLRFVTNKPIGKD